MSETQVDSPVVVLISANQEWRVVCDYFRPAYKMRTPFGESFVQLLNGTEVVFVHGGGGAHEGPPPPACSPLLVPCLGCASA